MDQVLVQDGAAMAPYNTVLEVQDGVIDVMVLFGHIDRGLGIKNDNTTEVNENGQTG